VTTCPRTIRAVVGQLATVSAATIVQNVAVPFGEDLRRDDGERKVGKPIERVEEPHQDRVH
jgi:hypothetical protein